MTTLPWKNLNTSYDRFMGTCSIKSGDGVFQGSQTLKMTNNQKGRRNPIRRSGLTNLSYHGTSQRLQLRPKKSMEAERLTRETLTILQKDLRFAGQLPQIRVEAYLQGRGGQP